MRALNNSFFFHRFIACSFGSTFCNPVGSRPNELKSKRDKYLCVLLIYYAFHGGGWKSPYFIAVALSFGPLFTFFPRAGWMPLFLAAELLFDSVFLIFRSSAGIGAIFSTSRFFSLLRIENFSGSFWKRGEKYTRKSDAFDKHERWPEYRSEMPT